MADGFTKLFHSITTSTVWMQPDNVRLVWITMMALADKDGCVSASIPGLAHAARVELTATEAALKVLSEPDPYSRTPEDDGRRIRAIDGGWLLVNHAKYRNTRDFEDRKEYERTRKAKLRERNRSGQSGTGPDIPGHSAHTEAEADTDLREKQDSSEPAEPALVPVVLLPLHTGAPYPVHQGLLDEWQLAYKHLNVQQELEKMRVWLDANPHKRKTKTGIKRFCVNWLNRAQDNGGGSVPRGTPRQSGGGSIGKSLR